MDTLDAMQVFVSVAELQSFAATARRHALSTARVTRAVAALEERLGIRLLHRTTRAVRLTEAGASYLVQCKRILSDVSTAEAQAKSAHGELSGQLSITAPRLFGRLHVASVVSQFLKRHKHVTMRVLFADQVLDFYEQNLDVAIRIAHLPDSGLAALRVGQVRRVVCASPAYLRERGVPSHPLELSQHDLITFGGEAAPQAWTFRVSGHNEAVAVRPRLLVNSSELAISATLAGNGLTRVLAYQVAQELADKKLRVVLAEYELPPVPVHVVHAEPRTSSARVRAFVALAGASLRRSLSEVEALVGPQPASA
jgi:DNA-binding transcriptional LysR family regulator